jgi:DNA-binding CsgD family transcriptional regulator
MDGWQRTKYPERLVLVGRSSELAKLGGIVDEVRSGGSSALLVRGEAGVGKTVLLDELVRLADDFLVIRIEGIESELQLGYAALHRVVLPFMDRIDPLPEPQRVAIRTTFGLETSARSDRFLVGLAVLTLLGDAERSTPLLVVVDDAQWLDQDSLGALAFVARRLQADRVALVLAARDPLGGGFPTQGLEKLVVGRLKDEPARELLTSLVSVPVPGQVAAKIVAATGGNPLALTGLVEELTGAQLAGVSALPDPLPTGELVQATFARQVNLLPEETQTALLLAAAEPTRDRMTIERAAQELGISLAALEPAKAQRLITTDTGIEFRHPLVRSVVYSNATPASRRSAHLALAAALYDSPDRDRWAMHRGLAATHQDEEVAAALEESAVHARARGGFTAETALLTRAANLTPSSRERSRRLLAAAHAASLAGSAPQAKALLELARQGDLDELDQARVKMLDGRNSVFLGEGWRSPVLLLDAAKSLAPLDAELSRQVLLASLCSVLTTYHGAEGTTGREIGKVALISLEGTDNSTVDSLLRGIASAFVCDYPQAVNALRRAVETFERMSSEEINEWHLVGPFIANDLWDHEVYGSVVKRLEAASREQGAILSLQHALLASAAHEIRGGRFAEARTRYAELLDVTEAIGGFTDFYALLDIELLAWEGDEEAARSKIAKLIESAAKFGAGSCILEGYHALATLELGLGRYPEALKAAQELDALDAPSWSHFAWPMIVEAAMRCGDSNAATHAVARIEERAQVVETPYALGLMWRCRALVSDDERTQTSFDRSIEWFQKCSWATERARTHLLYGEWLRRRRQRTEARAQLRTAHEMFDSMDAKAYAERARLELEATGERARKRTVDTAVDLTARESQIAGLAAEGLTNREIASRLFISPATVDYHLNKAFAKLGVNRRSALAKVLSS